jgi:hypothetical protein
MKLAVFVLSALLCATFAWAHEAYVMNSEHLLPYHSSEELAREIVKLESECPIMKTKYVTRPACSPDVCGDC